MRRGCARSHHRRCGTLGSTLEPPGKTLCGRPRPNTGYSTLHLPSTTHTHTHTLSRYHTQSRHHTCSRPDKHTITPTVTHSHTNTPPPRAPHPSLTPSLSAAGEAYRLWGGPGWGWTSLGRRRRASSRRAPGRLLAAVERLVARAEARGAAQATPLTTGEADRAPQASLPAAPVSREASPSGEDSDPSALAEEAAAPRRRRPAREIKAPKRMTYGSLGEIDKPSAGRGDLEDLEDLEAALRALARFPVVEEPPQAFLETEAELRRLAARQHHPLLDLASRHSVRHGSSCSAVEVLARKGGRARLQGVLYLRARQIEPAFGPIFRFRLCQLTGSLDVQYLRLLQLFSMVAWDRLQFPGPAYVGKVLEKKLMRGRVAYVVKHNGKRITVNECDPEFLHSIAEYESHVRYPEPKKTVYVSEAAVQQERAILLQEQVRYACARGAVESPFTANASRVNGNRLNSYHHQLQSHSIETCLSLCSLSVH